MKNNLQIIKQLQNKFGWFYYKLKSNEVTHLKLNYKGVETKDLELIGELTSLEELELYNNKIDTIQGLDKLTKLEELQLGDNQITKIEGLEKLTKLEYLYLDDNNIIYEIIDYLSILPNENFLKNVLLKLENNLQEITRVK